MNLPTNENHPSLSQVDSLLHILKTVGAVKEHWDIDNSYHIFTNLSIEEYKYLIAIVLNHKMNKINKKLQDLGVKRIPNNAELGYQKKSKNEIF